MYIPHEVLNEPIKFGFIPMLLQGLSMAGGIAGALRKPITPNQEYMNRMWGEGAVMDRASQLAQKITGSAYGQQLLGSAAEQGQEMQNAMNQRAAASGFGAAEGAESGASTFATGAASGAASNLMRQQQASNFQNALSQTQQNVAAERQQYLNDIQQRNARPNAWQQIGSVAGQIASLYPSNGNTKKKKKTDKTTTGQTTASSQTAAPTATGTQEANTWETQAPYDSELMGHEPYSQGR